MPQEIQMQRRLSDMNREDLVQRCPSPLQLSHLVPADGTAIATLEADVLLQHGINQYTED